VLIRWAWLGVQLIGVACKDCVIIACDGSVARGPVKFKNSEDKIYHVDGSKMMGVTGPTGDRVNFTEYIMRNIQLYALRNGVSLSTHAAANYTRYDHQGVESRGKWQVQRAEESGVSCRSLLSLSF
jgi:20S proteasome subunit beta 4